MTLPLAACGGSGGASTSLTTAEIADNIHLITGAGANVTAVKGPDGVVLVDGGAPDFAEELERVAARAVGERDVQALFNTHWHPEQTGANARLGGQGVPIIAHENTKQWLGSEIHVRWQDTTYPPLPAEALPSDTIYETGAMELGDERAEYGHMLHAHTDGDIYVKFPRANVLVAGGALTSDRWPIIDWWTGGYIGGLLDAHETLLPLADDETVIVPSDGPVMSLADLHEQAEMYLTIFDRLATLLKDSMSPAEAVAARPTEGFKEEWGDPDLFVELAFRSFYGHLRGNTRLGPMP